MSETISNLDLSKVGRTNLCHSDEERRLIDEEICRTNEALKRVREEERAIILREESLQSDINRYLSARAPIKRLPDNVLCNVFEWHCQDATPVAIPFSILSIPPQITISHVCSTWRQIMLHIPAFWSNIRLESDLATNTGKKVDVVHAWLSRAKSLPSSVEIVFENNSWSSLVQCQVDEHRNIVKDVISLFKLKKLHLAFDYYDLRDLLQFPDEKLCCIEDLYIRQVHLSNSTTIKTVLPFELHKLSSLTSFSLFGPLLEELGIFGVAPEDGSRFASIPWHQLRHINMHMTFPMLFCLRVLELSSVLETCSLDVYVDSSFMTSPPSSIKEPVHCNQLREFKVDIYSPSLIRYATKSDDIIDPFLGSLRCPTLKSLTVGSIERSTSNFNLPPSINLQTLLRMQHISEMHLEELTISNTHCDLEILPLMASFRSLRRLVLPHAINFTEEAMDELGSGSIAPFLEDLTINKPVPELERLFQMIKTRSSVGKEDGTGKYKATPFKSVLLYCQGSARKKYADTVKEINESGVNLTVKWRNYGFDVESITSDVWCGGDRYHDGDNGDDISDIYEW